MPASHQTSRSILVLEQYDALAAAISSALKKFAPEHASFVASSFPEAQKIASKANPELFIFDVDPPWSGITDFLDKMRAILPEARALVIGAPIPSEVAAQRGSFGAIQFIEKPFELATFGAGVQALLGPWRKAESNSARGCLGSLNALDVVLLHAAAAATVVIEVRSRSRSGQIYLTRGEVSHAATGKLQGTDALWEILTWSGAHFSETKTSASQRRTLETNWPAIVTELLREVGPAPQPIESLTVPPAVAEERPTRGHKIVVIDDTEMLLIFVEDILATANPQLQITTALNATDGLREIERIIPDLVLLDYSLPDFNGDEVCKRLLQNKQTANVPILMMSGHVAEMTAAAARLPNVAATIEKPFFSEQLISLVRRALGRELPVKRQPASAPVETPVVQRQAKAPPPPVRSQPSTVEIKRPAGVGPIVRVTSDNDAVIGLYLEVVAMQLTQQFQMGAIRAKPISPTVSLHLSSIVRERMPAEIGFQLGATELDANGRLSKLRLIPTATPFQPRRTRNAFEIGGVSLVPNKVRTRVQLTPAGTTPMTMELLAHLELTGVELSPNFQVSQLILRMPTNVVRVTLNPKAPEQAAAKFELAAVRLESSARIAEMLLRAIR